MLALMGRRGQRDRKRREEEEVEWMQGALWEWRGGDKEIGRGSRRHAGSFSGKKGTKT